MRKLLLVLGVLLIAASASAQTTTAKLGWDQQLLAGQTIADLQAAVWTLKIDAGAPVVVVTTCVAGTPNPLCTTPLGPFVTTGTHTLIITGTNGFGSVSGSLTGSSLAVPVNIKVVITVTVP